MDNTKHDVILEENILQTKSEIDNKTKLKILKRLFQMVAPIKKTMLKCIIFGILGHLSSIFILSSSAMMVAYLMGYKVLEFTHLGLAVIIFGFLRGVLHFKEQYNGHDVAFRLLAIIRNKIFHKLRKLAPSKMATKKSGDFVQMIQSDVESIETFFAHTIAPVVIGFVVPVIVVIIIGSYWIFFAFILIIAYLLIGFVLPLFSFKYGKNIGRTYRTNLSKINAHTLDSLQGLKDIILYNHGDVILDQINQNSHSIIQNKGKIRKNQNTTMGFAESSLIISTLMIFFVGLYHASNSPNFSIPQLIIIVIMSYSSFGPVLALIPLGGHLNNTIAAANRIFCLLDEVPSVKDPSEEELVDISIRNPGEIKLNSINFRYHGGQEELLSNVSLDIQTGSKIALIGPSGCGKSTLLRLIMRYWDVDSGNIKMDEVNIRNYLLQNLRSNIAIFSQNTYLFNTTIKENIRIGKYNASEDEIILAAKQANIHNFILSLPNGYDSKVGELGGKISSGEKQRIGMARTLIQKREVIFLDEPTSNLDFLNEKALLKTINETFSKNTILIVSHRPSTIKDSDEVWMLKNKNIIVNTDKFNDWSRIPRAACKDL